MGISPFSRVSYSPYGVPMMGWPGAPFIHVTPGLVWRTKLLACVHRCQFSGNKPSWRRPKMSPFHTFGGNRMKKILWRAPFVSHPTIWGLGQNPCSALQIKHDKDHCVPPLWPASQNQYCQRAQKHSGPIEHKDTQRGQPQAAPSIFWPHKMWFATLTHI